MKNYRFEKTAFVVAGALLFGQGTVACSSSGPGVETSDKMGEMSLALVAEDGSVINSVGYIVTNSSGATVLDDSINVSDPNATVSVAFELPEATAYRIALTATTTAGSQCAGAAIFDVVSGQTGNVNLDLFCTDVNDGNATGGTVVNGHIVPGNSANCPDVAFASAATLQTSVGGTIALRGGATSADSVLAWTATSGTIAPANSIIATYTCTAAGPATITLTVSRFPTCSDSESFTVLCVAPGEG